MDKFDKYLLDNKLKYIYRFVHDAKKDFGIDVKPGTGFKNIQFYYSANIDGKMYVHKDALHFVYTNADTYVEDSREIQSFKFCKDQSVIDDYNKKIETIFDFIRSDFSKCEFFPRLLDESPNFFVFECLDEDDWEPVYRLRVDDRKDLVQKFNLAYGGKKNIVSPFKSELSGEIYRNKNSGNLRIFDMAKLKSHVNDFFVIYFCDRRNINTLYVLKANFLTFKKTFLKAYQADFDTEYAEFIKL